jgi:hypothetical protein
MRIRRILSTLDCATNVCDTESQSLLVAHICWIAERGSEVLGFFMRRICPLLLQDINQLTSK